MNYQNYEDYMRSVLGYSPYAEDNYTYTNSQEDLYAYTNEVPMQQINTQDLTKFYPEIYKMVYPMVCKACNSNSSRELTNELLESMTEEICKNVEPEEEHSQRNSLPPLKNGDVRNPNAKEPKLNTKETRQSNSLLRDLIKILILREWGRPNRPPIRPPFPPPGRPPMGPGGPGMPPRPGNGRPPMGPPPRPRYF